MAYISTFILSVGANVASYYICKWLDGWLKGRKHSAVSFWRIICYNGFAALPAHFMGREVKPNGVYFYLCPVRRSECSVLLHLQVA